MQKLCVADNSCRVVTHLSRRIDPKPLPLCQNVSVALRNAILRCISRSVSHRGLDGWGHLREGISVQISFEKEHMAKQAAVKDKKTVTYGRPRLLTHDEIIDGALEIGLEGLTMKKLATHLNVGTATLYQYWDNRQSMLRAAAVRALRDVDMPTDTGQHWSHYALGYAVGIARSLSKTPSFILSYHFREYGLEAQFTLAENFLSAMEKRGIGAKAGMELFNVVSMAVYAGAIETVRQQEFDTIGADMQETARDQMSQMEVERFPLLRQVLDDFSLPPEKKIETMLRPAFEKIARERGEPLESILDAA